MLILWLLGAGSGCDLKVSLLLLLRALLRGVAAGPLAMAQYPVCPPHLPGGELGRAARRAARQVVPRAAVGRAGLVLGGGGQMGVRWVVRWVVGWVVRWWSGGWSGWWSGGGQVVVRW